MNVMDMNLQLALKKKKTNRMPQWQFAYACVRFAKNYFQARIPETITGE